MKWKYNVNVEIELPSPTLKNFDSFFEQNIVGLFMDKETINNIREKFKKDFNLKESKK